MRINSTIGGSRLFLLAALLVLASLVTSSCTHSSLRTGYRGSHRPGQACYRYVTLHGTEHYDTRVEAGQTLELDYELAVTKSELVLGIEDPHGKPLWEERFHEGAEDAVAVEAEHTGRYRILVQAQGAGGGYDLNWRAE